jgi:hypothetical protein
MRKYKLSNTVRLFHICKEFNPKGIKRYPRVPENIIIGMEDDKTKRVCVSTSIFGCINSIGYKDGDAFWVYEPVDYEKIADHIYQPTVKEVPDVTETREKWITCPVKMKCVGYAEIEFQTGKNKYKVYYTKSIKHRRK